LDRAEIARASAPPPRGFGVTLAHSRLSVSVVIPAKNEAANLAWVLARIPPWVKEVVLVDGQSTDKTLEVARESWPQVVLVHEKRSGKGAALRAGFEMATGDVVVMLDGDGSMDPDEFPLFIDAIDRGADLAKGSRRIPGAGSADLTRIRQVGNRALLSVANALFDTEFTELCYGYMALRRDKLPLLRLVSDGFEIETEIVVRAVVRGLNVTEVPSFEARRRSGKSNLRLVRDGLRIVRTLLRVRLGLPRAAEIDQGIAMALHSLVPVEPLSSASEGVLSGAPQMSLAGSRHPRVKRSVPSTDRPRERPRDGLAKFVEPGRVGVDDLVHTNVAEGRRQ
jgi:hypothetical protein